MLTGNTKTDKRGWPKSARSKHNISLKNICRFCNILFTIMQFVLLTENWSIIIIIPKITLWPSEPTLLHYEWLIVLPSDDRGFRKSFIKYHSQKEELHETWKCTLFSKSKDKVVTYIHQYVDYFVLVRWPIRRHIFFRLIHMAVDKKGHIHHSSAVQNFIC